MIVATDIVCTYIVDKTPYLLLVNRMNEPKKWALPGGRLEPDLTAALNVIKELEEEASYSLHAVEPTMVGIADYPKRDTRTERVVSIIFRHRWQGKELPVVKGDGEETSEAKWFSEEEWKEMDLAFDHMNILKEFY